MPTLLTLSSLMVSFLVTLIITPYWIKRATGAGLLGEDKNKLNKLKIPELGGLCVVSGFLFGILFYVAVKVLVYKINSDMTMLFATVVSVLIATMIGFVDDILGWKIGLRVRYKIILTFFIALPIMAINAGHSVMTLPLIGPFDFGLLYPIILVPIAIIGTSNGFNMLAGYNGLEAGMGVIILSVLGFLSWKTGSSMAAVLAFCMVFALIAFILFNKYPAKVFPGDTLTYSVGALIAIIAILGNIEKFALILFIPYFIELVLKARGRMKKESFAKVEADGSLSRPYDKYYGVEHVAIDFVKMIKKKAYEFEVVFVILGFQLLVAIITLLYFFFPSI